MNRAPGLPISATFRFLRRTASRHRSRKPIGTFKTRRETIRCRPFAKGEVRGPVNVMRILITNDDGVYSPGLAALAEIASGLGEVRIVAPHVEMSSAAHSITSARPLTYKRTPLKDVEAYRVNGTPADCVALGIHQWKDAELVLSGINLGSNLGNSLWPSGTLAAARQAALMGLRGIALSTPAIGEEADFATLKPAVLRVLQFLLPMK